MESSHKPLLLTLGLGVFAGALDLGVLSPALPALAAAFGVGARAIAWVFTLYLLANVVAIPLTTQLADRYGRRPIYILCVAVFAAGSVLSIVAPSFNVFLCARAIQAAGAGGIFPVATAAIGDRIPPERRGAALGLVAATWGLAAILGPLVGGTITHFLSWHWIFAANVPLALLVIALARVYVPASAAHARGPLDAAGIGLLAAGLLATMTALTQLDARTATFATNETTLWALLAAAVCFGLLVPVERRAAQPVIAPALLRNRQILTTYGLEILIGALEGALFFIPAALVAAQGMSLVAAGAIAAVGAVVFVAVIPLAGRALDAVGSRTVLSVGAALSGGGLLLFALAMQSPAGAIAAMIVAGVGFGALLGAPTRYIVTGEVGEFERATAVGLLSIFLIIGQILGAALAGGVAGSHPGAFGFVRAYETFAAVAVAAIAVTFFLKSRKDERAGAVR
ncbi:MAG: MFS transporter [Candidatus Eremiobacteraeota bacterium]|nr:MFS transporter [Candidatus Eremiobacteraeota bacterium]